MTTDNTVQLSIRYLQAGDLDRAEQSLHTLLRRNGRHAWGWFLLGVVRHTRGQVQEAIASYREAARLDHQYADPHNNLGWAYNQLGKPTEAISHLRQALRLRRKFPEAQNNLGNAYLLLRKNEEALACFREAVRLRPDFAEALNNIALILIPRHEIDEAQTLLERALRAKPGYADALVNLSWVYLEKGDWDLCLANALQALQMKPDSVSALNNAGNALLGLNRLDEAVACLERAVQLRPDRADFLNNLAFAFTRQGRWSQATETAAAAVRLQPDLAEAFNNLGLAHINLRRPDEGRTALEEAVRLKPSFPEALCNLGWCLLELGDYEGAVQRLQESLRIKPDAPDTLNNLGLAYNQIKKPEEARDCYERAVQLRPDFAEALGGLGDVFGALGRHEEAVASYRRSLALKPTQTATYSNFLFTLHYLPSLTPGDLFREHLGWARANAVPPASPPSFPNRPDPERRLRIGYVSADFARHVMGWYIEPVLENHDRERFETYCYSNVKKADDVTQSIQQRTDHWRDVFRIPDEEVEEIVRRDRIDILVDLSNHTGGNRLTLFARRPAPVQATHLGLQFTTGNPFIDYRITDAGCDPPGLTESYNTEQLLRLPDVSLCYRTNLSADVNDLPAASTGRITFGFFNNFSKITPQAVSTWATIFKRLPGSRLMLVAGISPKQNQQLLDAFAHHGIDSSRLTLVGRQSRQDYYRLYNRVDLTLDSFPYTGCFTTCDSLWMGVPLVTLAGRSSMARQGASLLAHLGLPDLITQSLDEYVETVVRLAQDLSRLAELRASLRERMERSTLMNYSRFTRQLEELYRGMWRQWCARQSG